MVWVLIAILGSCAMCAQVSFDVASVKPSDPASRRGVDFRILPSGSLRATNVTAVDLIEQAYSLKHYEFGGGPAWLRSDRFDIEAKAEGDPDRAQLLAMLQTLLADRFQLRVHREDREQSIYALVAAKRGPKLEEPKKDDLRPYVRVSFTGTPSEKRTYVLSGHKASLAMLAEHLGEAKHPVLDRTGIAGVFDFKLEYAADDAKPEYGPSLFTALQEQLGLKLEPAKGPISTLVIDHVEKPSSN